ncbi:hypothetical protein [Marimonas arenosa]|uniref:Tetratricopeptide repeat protein n=1 Tax=Marimonas arenosa TaxID=1795305 RepID=A0AAE3WCZ0_9RHOB|nr:hypothetical protein [Marimonas arenosa]MDQ2090946.1 tetratricopeptide repeat protein [Marimonas arenosa]
MLGRLITAIFWAAIFFALGAWSGGSLKPIGDALTRGGKAIAYGAREAWRWAFAEGAQGSDSGTAAPAHATAPASSDDTLGTGVTADLAAARQSFASGDVKAAITRYKVYLAANPADADAHGELGNVYYYNGEVGEAAGAYYSAALYLLAEGRNGEAQALVPAISIGAPALAADLRNRIAIATAMPATPAGLSPAGGPAATAPTAPGATAGASQGQSDTD